ncbi:MAG: hypothetical protein AAF490_23620 [Chloroflexota bacterium]
MHAKPSGREVDTKDRDYRFVYFLQLEKPYERLWDGMPYQAIQAMYGHNCYHTAELLTVRPMQGLGLIIIERNGF